MAPRKNLKWQVHEAVMDSSLPPAQRLLMFVFSDLADADTGVIPEERKAGTTIKELARRTGYDEATIKRHKPELIKLGWVRFERPTWKQQSNHETGVYTIAVGRNPVAHNAPPVKSRKGRTKPDPGAHHAPPVRPDQDPDPNEAGAQDAPPPGAHSAPPPGAHSAPPPGAQDAPPEGFENDRPGAHHAPPGGAQCAPPVAHPAPPIEEHQYQQEQPTFFGSTADAAAPDNTTAKPRRGKPKTDQPRPDVEALCNRLAELMVANECKPPTINQRWRDETRRMLDRDGRDFDKAMRLLEWSQQHRFWKSNIHSMPKFREQYDQLRLQANAEWEQHRSRGRGGPDWGAVMARAEARDAAQDTAPEDDDEPLWRRALPA